MLRPNERVKKLDQAVSGEGRAAIFTKDHLPKKKKSGGVRPSSAKPSDGYLEKIKNEPGSNKSLFRPSHGYLSQFQEAEKEQQKKEEKPNDDEDDIENVI